MDKINFSPERQIPLWEIKYITLQFSFIIPANENTSIVQYPPPPITWKWGSIDTDPHTQNMYLNYNTAPHHPGGQNLLL